MTVTKVARSITPFVGVMKRDKKERPTQLVVPASEGKQNRVFLYRHDTISTIDVLCKKFYGYEDVCIGAHYKHFCKHIRAALFAAVADQDRKSYWCTSLEDATRMQNLTPDGRIVTIRLQNDIKVQNYLVVYS